MRRGGFKGFSGTLKQTLLRALSLSRARSLARSLDDARSSSAATPKRPVLLTNLAPCPFSLPPLLPQRALPTPPSTSTKNKIPRLRVRGRHSSAADSESPGPCGDGRAGDFLAVGRGISSGRLPTRMPPRSPSDGSCRRLASTGPKRSGSRHRFALSPTCTVRGLGFMVYGLWFGVWGLGFRV